MKCSLIGFFLLCVIIIVAIVALYRTHTSMLDGLDGWLLQVFYKDATVYASGYNDTAFKSIQNGESMDDVLGKIGKPLRIYIYHNGRCAEIELSDALIVRENHILIWRYTESSGNFRIRDIYFRGQHVFAKESSFYLD